MAKRGKRYNEISQKVDKMKVYTPEEALDLVFETKSAKFVETVELAIRLGVDPRHADQQVRGTVSLPNGTGKTVRILAYWPFFLGVIFCVRISAVSCTLCFIFFFFLV